MKKALMLCTAAVCAVLLSGCAGAAFNRIHLETVRNVTVGQELMDLKAAHEKGVISDTEYTQAKQNVLKLLNDFSQLDATEQQVFVITISDLAGGRGEQKKRQYK